MAPTDTAACFHGGASFTAIGDGFDRLDQRDAVVNADVLDAWFDPAPAVVAAVAGHLPWLLRSSPPAGCDGLLRAIARTRGVPAASLAVGAGSSDLIHRALARWVPRGSRVLVPEPTYGEYAHVLGGLIGCRVERFALDPADGFALDPERLVHAAQGCALVVIVNPNNPTGRHVPRAALERALARLPAGTLAWIDEAYVDYVAPEESLERFAAASADVVVCKSLSKAYALSGARAAYLCAAAARAADLRAATPPWAVGLPAQVAAVAALGAEDHYRGCWARTATQRAGLAASLRRIDGVDVQAGVINAVVCAWRGGPDAAAICARCAEDGVFLRALLPTAPSYGPRALRSAVKDRAGNARIVAALARAMASRAQAAGG